MTSNGPRQTNYQFVMQRLKDMEERPSMWATNMESYGLQLVLLAEFAELDMEPGNRILKDRLMNLVFGPGNIVHDGPLEDAWAKERLNNVRRALRPL